MSKNIVNSYDQWLIKSAGRVLGPFKLTEVVSGLQLKHFSVMDEISMPYGRWVLIRDELSLQEMLKSLRKVEDNYDSTMTLTATSTAVVTKTTTLADYEEITDSGVSRAISPPPFPMEKRGRIRDSSNDPQVKAMLRRRALMMNSFVVMIVVVLASVGYFLFFRSKLSGASDEIMMQFANLKNQGLYEKALDLLNKAKLVDKNNLEIDTEVAFIQVGFYNQTVSARRVLEKAIGKVDDKHNGAAIYTSIALTYILEGDWKNASDQIQKALAKEPQFQPALFNKGALDFRSGQFEKSEKDFEPVIPGNPNDAYVILGSAMSSLEVARKGLMPVRIMPVLNQMLDEYLKSNFDLEQEVYVIQAFIYNQLNKPKERMQIIQKMLSGDLERGKFHKVDLFEDRNFVSWKSLQPYCQAVAEGLQRDPVHRSLWAYCLFRAGNDIEAKKIILDVAASQPNDSIVNHVKAYLLMQMGQEPEAKASLNIALMDKTVRGALVLKGKICEKENNDSCVMETYSQLLDQEPRALSAYLGLARLENKKGNKKGAIEWVNRGLALSTTYLPLWDLKNILPR